jgi:hypothetical protein
MNDLHGMPNWLSALVRGRWSEADWQLWDDDWRPELERRGVTPELLDPVGSDFTRPTGIGVRVPGGRWCSADLDWEGDGEKAVFFALQRLVDELDSPASPERPKGSGRGW